MENIFLIALLIFIAWNVIAIRKDISVRNISTNLFLSITSNEEDANGIPFESIPLLKKTKISFAIVPGMDLAEPGESMPLQVTKVVFEDFNDNVRGIHLKSKRVPLTELEIRADSYRKNGWQNC